MTITELRNGKKAELEGTGGKIKPTAGYCLRKRRVVRKTKKTVQQTYRCEEKEGTTGHSKAVIKGRTQQEMRVVAKSGKGRGKRPVGGMQLAGRSKEEGSQEKKK